MSGQVLTAVRSGRAAAWRSILSASTTTTAAASLGRKAFKPAPLAAAFSTQPLRHESESFLTGTSSIYAEEMYERYLQDPNAVEPSWKTYFDNLEHGTPYVEADYNRPTVSPGRTLASLEARNAVPSDSLGVAHLIRAYQVNGHTAAKLDPLDIHTPLAFPYRPSNTMDLTPYGGYPPELTIEYHGFTEADLDRRLNFKGTSSGGNKGYLEDLANSPDKMTLRNSARILRSVIL